MPTAPLKPRIFVEEYLQNISHPDCDYVDGVIEERNLGETDHGWVQASLTSALRIKGRPIGLGTLTETRMQVAPTRFRTPDIMVTRGRPAERIITKPPLLCIEILSLEDRMSRMQVRINEYLAFGVPVVWIVDPAKRTIEINRPTGVEQATDPLHLDNTEIAITFSEIFD